MYLINTVKRMGMPRWIVVLPLLHLLKGNTKPFEAPSSGNGKYGPSWAGLGGLDMGTSAYMSSQEKRYGSLFLCFGFACPDMYQCIGTNTH